jgi:hypothetical protein
MKRLCMTAILVLLSGSAALAQTSQNGGFANPSAPRNNATVGAPSWVNPSNSQDISGKSNPQDLTRPGASNREDLMR